MSLWSERCIIVASWQSQHPSIKKTKNWKNKALKIRPSRPNRPLIRPNPDHGPDYKDFDQTFQTELTSDQTEPRPWPRLKRIWWDRPDRTDLWSDRNQTMVQTIVRSNRFPDPVISVWEHRGVRSIGSDHSSIWVWAKTWEVIVCLLNTPVERSTLWKDL